MIYAAVQQFGAAKGAFGRTSRGAPIPWGNIPARPFLGISAEDEPLMLEIVAEWFQAAATGGA
jgi:phage gpG-like protein